MSKLREAIKSIYFQKLMFGWEIGFFRWTLEYRERK